MTFGHAMTISLGTLVALPIVLLLAVIFAIGAVALWRCVGEVDDNDRSSVWIGSIACAAVTAGLLIGAAIGMWPYDSEYHTWRTTSGFVKTVTSRLVGSGEGMNQRFVVTYSDGRQRACDDTRCSTVKAGDWLTLKCKRAYQWGGTPGYDCNWVKNESLDARFARPPQ